jgi:hypothetical protein
MSAYASSGNIGINFANTYTSDPSSRSHADISFTPPRPPPPNHPPGRSRHRRPASAARASLQRELGWLVLHGLEPGAQPDGASGSVAAGGSDGAAVPGSAGEADSMAPLAEEIVAAAAAEVDGMAAISEAPFQPVREFLLSGSSASSSWPVLLVDAAPLRAVPSPSRTRRRSSASAGESARCWMEQERETWRVEESESMLVIELAEAVPPSASPSTAVAAPIGRMSATAAAAVVGFVVECATRAPAPVCSRPNPSSTHGLADPHSISDRHRRSASAAASVHRALRRKKRKVV